MVNTCKYNISCKTGRTRNYIFSCKIPSQPIKYLISISKEKHITINTHHLISASLKSSPQTDHFFEIYNTIILI